MIIEWSADFTPKPLYDVCIVGAGPAGITLARSLARRGHSVFLAEGGERGYSPDSQDCYRGRVDGDPYFELELARLRFLGGTSNHWGGWCRRLDARDFKAKGAASQARWPIGPEALDPYDREVREILELSPAKPDKPLPNSTVLQQLSFCESNPPVKFGLKYEDELAATPGIDLSVNANFVGFDTGGVDTGGFDTGGFDTGGFATGGADGMLSAARFRNYAGFERAVAARRFVLACGCIENSRLLLNENRRFDNRLGNQGDCVGRYWMEHPTFTLGDFILLPDYFGDGILDVEELDMEAHVNRRWFIGATGEFLEQKRILNCAVRLEPVTRSRSRQYVADLVCNSPNVLQPLLADFGRDVRCVGQIRAAWEQEPRPDNRITLDKETDPFGIPRVVLHWRKSPLDRRTPRELALEVARYLAEQDVGRVRLDPWVLDDAVDPPADDELAGYHHMGGTRMADSPAEGVTDRDCRVFGTRNLFVAGSSLFASGGHANPTQTIVGLALRLADHLHATLAPSMTPVGREAVQGG